jgi:8-oxo-dGTP pyrophosphatase MutT (NUDIX family)
MLASKLRRSGTAAEGRRGGGRRERAAAGRQQEGCSGHFLSPGGKPGAGESLRQALVRELGEELGVVPVGMRLLGEVDEAAAIERVPMRMTVFTAGLDAEPRPAAELAALGWTSGGDEYAPLLAAAVSRHVIPLLRGAGSQPG